MSEIERESMEYDVVIVGAGPAGLSAAIRLKQLDADLDVVVLEKGSEVGAHILSGAVLDPSGLSRLIPDWKEKGAPVTVEVKKDKFFVLGEAGKLRLAEFHDAAPDEQPRQLHRFDGQCLSLDGRAGRGDWVLRYSPAWPVRSWFTAMTARCKGVIAGEFGKNADGTPAMPNYEPGMELLGKYVFISEGVRGSLAKQVIAEFDLDADCDVPKFGIGMKEIWEVDPEKHDEGLVLHTMGWPLGFKQSGGSFMYHLDNNQVYVGYIVDLNYKNPHLFPYMEFQRFKHHPEIAKVLRAASAWPMARGR